VTQVDPNRVATNRGQAVHGERPQPTRHTSGKRVAQLRLYSRPGRAALVYDLTEPLRPQVDSMLAQDVQEFLHGA
jgi:hypothetical protein